MLGGLKIIRPSIGRNVILPWTSHYVTLLGFKSLYGAICFADAGNRLPCLHNPSHWALLVRMFLELQCACQAWKPILCFAGDAMLLQNS